MRRCSQEAVQRGRRGNVARPHNDPASQVEIEARRQALRDAPAHPRIEAASTPAELAAVWPLPTGNPVVRDIPPRLTGPSSKGRAPSDLFKKADEVSKPEPVLSELGPPRRLRSARRFRRRSRVRRLENGSDSQRRGAAKSVVLRAVVEAARNANADQIRYEMVLQAKNGRVSSMAQFEGRQGLAV